MVPKAPKYEGWESLGVAGQTLGHYLSACAMYYATSGDERFLQRLEYTINELDSCQQANGDGYLAAVPSSLFDVLHRYFAVHSPDDVVLWKDGILSFQTMENQPQPLTALCTPDDARDSKIIPFPTLSERQRISQ